MGSSLLPVRMKTALLFITVFVALSECKKHSNDAITEVELGPFQNTQHGVRGKVYKADNSTINIKYFDYDGTAPDAFFWVGTEGTPETVTDFSTTKILADSKHSYEYTDTANNKHYILKRSDKKDITLTLPSPMTVDSLRWISVWCRQERQNFGTVYIGGAAIDNITPGNNVIPDSEPEPEPETGKASSTSGIMFGVISTLIAVFLTR